MAKEASIALNRFGLGARPGEAAALGDPARWLKRQIAVLPAPEALTRHGNAADVIRAAPERGAMQGDAEARKAYREKIEARVRLQIAARMQHALSADTGFHERLVLMWSNRLAIGMTGNVRVAAFANDYEQSAIRPHVTGKFEDLLLASARHPAMLFYLNNGASIGPNSRAGQRGGERGLNENYARELLELHTIGVKGGYSQDDIIALAKILTGWTIARAENLQDDSGFVFMAQRHEPGRKRFMGRDYDEGEAAGIEAIHFLARHPATAERVAMLYATHFISDNPPEAVVKRLAALFAETGGDLGALAHAVVDEPLAWQSVLSKARPPLDYATAVLRGVARGLLAQGGEDTLRGVFRSLRPLGQMPFMAPSPQGWPDDAQSWFGPDQVMQRAEWAYAVASRVPQTGAPAAMASDLLGPLLSGTTQTAITRAPSAVEGLALLLASPEFNRR